MAGHSEAKVPLKISTFEKVKAEIRTGLVSSVIAEAALFPLDVVKLQQQISGGSALDVFRHVMRERGLRGLYKGLIGRLIQTITSNVGFFMWQTIALQQVAPDGKKLSTGLSLVVNMLAQQFNRLLTTPVDVVANVNQSDPHAMGFLSTFVHLARTGGRQVLWRGLAVSMILSFNPALMFTLVDKLTVFLKALRKNKFKIASDKATALTKLDDGAPDASLGASDMFWISGISKAVATLVTYPLIRAKSMQQTVGGGVGLWDTLFKIVQTEGRRGLYVGVLMLSYKTVLFNSLMMALKSKLTDLERQWYVATKRAELLERPEDPITGWRRSVVLAASSNYPWAIAARGGDVVYADGSWSFLHQAQEHLLRESRNHGEYLVVGVHSDQGHQEAVGSWPAECFAARVARLRQAHFVDAVLEGAPWIVSEDMMQELGITKVVCGTVSKLEDCSAPPTAATETSPTSLRDPYEVPRRSKSLVVLKSINNSTEHQVWMERASRILFSNVDASIDWRILVRDGVKTSWGQNPGYNEKMVRSEEADPLATRD